MSEKEVEIIFRALGKHEYNYKLIFKIMAYMGLRIGEVCKLKHADIIGDCETLRVALEKSKKIHDRIIPNKLKKDLREYTHKNKPANRDEYIFSPKKISNSKNKHIQPSSVSWRLFKLRKALELEDIFYKTKHGLKLNRISCHTFRHFFITEFYKKSGNDIMLTKDVIGHVKVTTTQGYIKPVDREREVVNLI